LSQLLFFDLDDTLIDHLGAEEGAQRETFETFPALYAGLSFDVWIGRYRTVNRVLWGAYGRGEIDRHTLQHQRFRQPLHELALDAGQAHVVGTFYMQTYRRHWRLNEGAEEILEDAARLGIVGVVSNGFVETQHAKMKRFRLDRWVKHLVLSEDVGAMKPARAIFDAAVRTVGHAAIERKVYIGDSFEHDVVGAKGAGWLPVLYNPSGKPMPSPVLYVKRLLDLKPLLE